MKILVRDHSGNTKGLKTYTLYMILLCTTSHSKYVCSFIYTTNTGRISDPRIIIILKRYLLERTAATSQERANLTHRGLDLGSE